MNQLSFFEQRHIVANRCCRYTKLVSLDQPLRPDGLAGFHIVEDQGSQNLESSISNHSKHPLEIRTLVTTKPWR